MDPLDELVSSLSGSSRAIIISERDVDLRPSSGDNRIFLLRIGEGSHAAGGRGGGFGERKVTGAACFQKRGGSWSKLFEASDSIAEGFEVPYYVSRIPLTLPGGEETMGYGVVEPELVAEMSKKSGIVSPP